MTDSEIADPFEILEAHRITSDLEKPRHVCSCGEVFDIDVTSDDRFAATGKHMGAVMAAAAEASRSLLQRADARNMELPEELRSMLNDIAQHR